MQVFTSVIVLGLCFTAFVISDIKDYKERKVAGMTSFAHVIGSNNTPAIDFKDNETAKKSLADFGKVSPDVIDAIILDSTGSVFASYKKNETDTFQFPHTLRATSEFAPHYLLISSPIIEGKETIGAVWLRVDLTELDELKNTQYSIAILLVVVGLGLSFLIAFIMQRYISRRLIYLAGFMQQVSHTEDYEKKVIEDGRDEISTLSIVFNKLMAQIMESQKKKDEFIGIASHELKTPLTSVKAYLQVLEKIEDKYPNKEYVQKTLNNVNKLQQLIYDLLDVSKIQSGQLHLDINEFDIDSLIDETISSFQIVSIDHTIIRRGDRLNKTISADRQRIEQVLMNLLSNAVKYSPDAKEVIVYTSITDAEVIIKIRDFGIGIPEEERDKIFDRFYRTKGMSVLISGFGLGLYICRDIIQRHHGEIWAQGEDVGTSFIFSLPLN